MYSYYMSKFLDEACFAGNSRQIDVLAKNVQSSQFLQLDVPAQKVSGHTISIQYAWTGL
jgi:hypothetical protein